MRSAYCQYFARIRKVFLEAQFLENSTSVEHNIYCSSIECKKNIAGVFMKKYIEERAVEVATYIIENNATVRQAAKKFGISKSTVHVVVTI